MTRLCSSRFEREARQLGWTRIAGLDEAGRGALFGPVVAAAVILNPKRRIVGLDDSKKLLPERRTELAARIRQHALAWAVAEIDAPGQGRGAAVVIAHQETADPSQPIGRRQGGSRAGQGAVTP